MQAKVVVLGAVGEVAPLLYAVPATMEKTLQPGHRVIVPLLSRRLTGLVVETGETLDSTGMALKPIAELLEPKPLFDQAHLKLLDFLASYYMTSLTDAYRSVVPGLLRVESHRRFKLIEAPDALRLAAFTPLERAVTDSLGRYPRTARQLGRLGDRKAVAAVLERLAAAGLIAAETATHGRHRPEISPWIRITAGAGDKQVRGPKQRGILEILREAGDAGMALSELEARLGVAGPILRALKARGLVEAVAGDPRSASYGASSGFEAQASQGAGEQGGILPDLNEAQRAAIAAVGAAVDEGRFETFLLWGITASGKTEIYLQLAARALKADRQVIVLVPEIALADLVVVSFRRRFGALVTIAHSAQNVAERWANWMATLSLRARILIGPRSAIFAPLHDPGLIVVDEEHDPAYKQEEGIRYNARDLAVALGQFARCPVVLGSATPSTESWANARSGRYRLLRLARRVMERALAQVEIVDLRREAGKPRPSNSTAGDDGVAREALPLSERLVAALRKNLAARGQTLLFLNRRGYHNFLQCHLCGSVVTCSNCSVSMTFHLRDRSLRCHYCGERRAAPEICPECGGLGLEGLGFGTERLAAAVGRVVPNARVERMDSDTSGRRGERARMLEALARGEIDILVGTQMITKGFDFPGVTLVGVILADLALNMPDFRSAERTFQLLTQVAGRAGRGERTGQVLIQTYAPGHYSIRAARAQDYVRFIRRELELRRELGYPPFVRLALVRIEAEDSARASAVAARAAAALARVGSAGAIRVLGPAPAPIERIRRRNRWQVMVKSAALREMRAALAAMRAEVAPLAKRANVHLSIDIDPVNML